ncbi:hypothetical protein PAPHI01_1803 [Pancytospora philotis]|nr:hypothetical protein PAPHI01_1803 [Pancytospora philotis]
MASKILIKSFLQPVGLKNKGNTCFFNATMQCLLSLPEFISYLKRCDFDKKRQPISHALRSFIHAYQGDKVYDPQEFIRSISSRIPLFNGRQQDAQSFLCTLLDLVIEEQGKEGGSAKERSREPGSGGNALREMFEAENVDVINCRACSYSNVVRTRATIQNLDIAASVQDALSDYLQKEELFRSDNDWECPRCKHNLPQIRRRIERTADYVIVMLNRFLNMHSKNMKSIRIDSEIELNGRSYESVGVICHVGSLHGGHYFSKSKRDGAWYEFNDSSVTKTTESFGPEQPYILFYAIKNK